MTNLTKKHDALIIVNFALVYLFWGSTYLAIRIVVTEQIPPLIMGAVRFSIAGGVLLVVSGLMGRKIWLNPFTLLRLGVIGVLLLTTGNVVLAWAEQYVPSGFAALMLATTPLWIAIIENLILKGERLAMKGIIGLLLGILGLVILLWPKLITTGEMPERFWLASGALMIAALSWSIGSVCSRRWNLDVDPLSATAWEMLIAGLVNSILALSLGDHERVLWTKSGLIALAYLIVAGSWIGFTAYIWLLKNVATAKVATFAYVTPVVAVFLGWLVLNESVDGFVFLGASVIIASVWLVTSAKVKSEA